MKNVYGARFTRPPAAAAHRKRISHASPARETARRCVATSAPLPLREGMACVAVAFMKFAGVMSATMRYEAADCRSDIGRSFPDEAVHFAEASQDRWPRQLARICRAGVAASSAYQCSASRAVPIDILVGRSKMTIPTMARGCRPDQPDADIIDAYRRAFLVDAGAVARRRPKCDDDMANDGSLSRPGLKPRRFVVSARPAD